jgi:GH24 family phage-related lysozyme (muramidase)
MSDLIVKLLGEEEGRSATVYKDTKKLWTIGIGCLVDARIRGAGLCDAAIDAQFAHDSIQARNDAEALPGFLRCNDIRQTVLVSMCFQLGDLHGWPDFKAALAMDDYEAAATAGRDSDWYKIETPKRAKREMDMLQSGQWIPHE